MKTRLFPALLGILLFMPAGCGGGNEDEGRATLRGVVVDGNPYLDGDVYGFCLETANGCAYKDPLPPPIAGVEVSISRIKGNRFTGDSTLAARVVTDSMGRFAVSLPPGFYEVYSDISQEKRSAGYCTSSAYLNIADGDDKSVVPGNDQCSKFNLIIE